MQVSPQAVYTNPIQDKPVGYLDLYKKVLHHQGITALFRGAPPLAMNLALQHTVRFFSYDYINIISGQYINDVKQKTLLASTVSALLTTVLSYPFDLAHGRMAADMSKK